MQLNCNFLAATIEVSKEKNDSPPQFPTNSLFTPVKDRPLHSRPNLWHPWSKGCGAKSSRIASGFFTRQIRQ